MPNSFSKVLSTNLHMMGFRTCHPKMWLLSWRSLRRRQKQDHSDHPLSPHPCPSSLKARDKPFYVKGILPVPVGREKSLSTRVKEYRDQKAAETLLLHHLLSLAQTSALSILHKCIVSLSKMYKSFLLLWSLLWDSYLWEAYCRISFLFKAK